MPRVNVQGMYDAHKYEYDNGLFCIYIHSS